MSNLRPELKRLHSPDVTDLERYQPSDSEQFGILVQALIGPVDMPGEESFDFMVCSPSWLLKELEGGGAKFGRHYLFMARYDYQTLRNTIRELCASIEAPDWQTAAHQLARFGKWEFEDYRERL